MPFTPDFGSVPDWVEAVGTSGALIFLAVQQVREHRKEKVATLKDQATKRDDEMKQARLVSVRVWWEFDEIGDPQDDRLPGWLAYIKLINDSEAPLRAMRPNVEERKTGQSGIQAFWHKDGSMTVMRPHEERTMVAEPVGVDLPPPADHPSDYDEHRPNPYEVLKLRFRIGAEFTDATGIRWLQTPEGHPERVIDPPRPRPSSVSPRRD